MMRTRWDYLVETYPIAELEAHLKSAGDRQWELVTLDWDWGPAGVRCVFKQDKGREP